MIPKVIHYCWFGGKELPPFAKLCITSWKKIIPDYQIIEWNESNFDVNSNIYTREAHAAGKYAFVTDYVRLHVLYNHGGIYMDTDVEVLKSFDCFLIHPAFSGFEDITAIPTGIMASEKGGKWVKEQLKYYETRHFLKKDGSYDLTTNVTTITNSMVAGGFRLDNTRQDYRGIITMYPKEYFCPKDYRTGKIHLTENTYCIHHFSGSWYTPYQRFKSFFKPLFCRFHLFTPVKKILSFWEKKWENRK